MLLGIITFFYIQTLVKENNALKQENNVKTNALYLLNEKIVIDSSNGKITGTVHSNEVDMKTFKLLLKDELSVLQKQVKDVNKISSYLSTGFTTTNNINTFLKDSIIYDTVRAKKFDLKDGYLNMNCLINNDSSFCTYSYQDSVTAIVYLNKNWKWYQFKKKKTMKSQGFDKFSSKVVVGFSNPKTSPIFIKNYLINK